MHSASSSPDPGRKQEQGGVSRLFLALSNTQYRWLWANSVVASLGRTSEMLAQGWLVLLLTESPFWVGVVSGLRGFGTVGLALFGGVIVDRMDRRKLMMAGQLVSAGMALTIALLILTGHIHLWHLLVIAVVQGMVMAVQMPARNALTYDVVGRHGLINALALNMMAFNLTRIVGSVIAGILIDTAGVEGVYLLIAGSLATGSLVLAFMGGSYRPTEARESVWRNAREGLAYAWGNKPVRSLLILSLLMEAFAFSHHVMLPVMARDVLGVGGTGYGLLASASGIGALVSTLVVAYLGDFQSKAKMVVTAGGGFGLFLMLFAVSPLLPFSYVVALVVLVLVGAMSMAYDTTMGALLQLLVPDAMRGRVMGLYVFTFGFTPLGGFLAGAIASLLGAAFAIGLGGGIVLTYILNHLRPMSRIREAEAVMEEEPG